MAGSRRGRKTCPSTPAPLTSALATPWAFLVPTDDLHALVARSSKRLLDPLAASVAEEQAARRQVNKKRRRSESESDSGKHLQLKSIYVDGFSPNQIWEQARRILESAGDEIDRSIDLLPLNSNPKLIEPETGEAMGSVDFSSSGDTASESDDLSDEGVSDDGSMEEDDDILEDSEQEEISVASASDGSLSDGDAALMGSDPEESGTFVEDRFGLNDGFFSIDDFNKQSELLERQDAKGDMADEDDDDEDEIDWHADPSVATSLLPREKGIVANKPSRMGGDEVEYSSEEEGPTFGNANLHEDSDSDDDYDAQYGGDADTTDWIDTSEIKYADFFAPPARKTSLKRVRALPKTQPVELTLDNDVDRAMADVRRDLFDDEMDSENEGQSVKSGGLQRPRSTHEKQRARIADEIRRLEAENVAKKAWMLTGEARAVERPVNSLIEEDLDFERVGKPVPVVTIETTEDIEAIVKRRILAKEFDEVVRRRPGTTDVKASRIGRFELEDTKSQQSLAQLYEVDHLRAADPNYVDSKDRKLMRQHTEVTNLWKDISSQLDILSNWHYKPKAPQAVITSVNDVATISMEDARPTAGSAAGGPSALAPQEIYAPGDNGRVAGEVVLKTGATISKDEMSREEKSRLRRQRKNQRKVDAKPTKRTSKVTEKQELVSELKKGGVKVVNKEGQVTDINGARLRTGPKTSADALKL